MTLPYGPPSTALLRELRQVGRDASAAVHALREANDLQDSFPRAVLEDLCWSLAGLKDGTAENCRPTLEYARGRIPQIRREHFFLEEEDLDENAPLPEVPRQDRGNRLDGKMKDLLASITTALDEYRVQAQDRFDDEVRGEEVVVLSHPEETTDPVARAADVIAATDKGRAELHDSGVDQSENGEVLSRRLKDTNNLALAARSLLQSGVIVRRWFEGIADAMQRMPDLIGAAGRALQVSANITGSMANWWSRTEHSAIQLPIEAARDLGGTLEDISTKLKSRRRDPPDHTRQDEQLRDPAAQPKQDGQFRDPSILRAEAEVERMLKAGIEVPTHLAHIVERIIVRGTENNPIRIARWHDIASFSSLEELDACYTDFELLEHGYFLSGKSNLSNLKLAGVLQRDLAPLGRLTTLTFLSLPDNSADDLTPLGQLTALTSLTLHVYGAADLAPLGRLTSLTTLTLDAPSATDLTPLGYLTVLTSLTLVSSSATDLAPLGRLTALTSLTLLATSTTDLTPLGQLTALTALTLEAKNANDLTPLGQLTALTTLTLDAPSATDLTPLDQLTALTALTLETKNANDLPALERLAALTSLNLHATRVSDLTPLGQLTGLTSLTLRVLIITDLIPLRRLTNLTSLTLRAEFVTDLTPLGRLTALSSLTLQVHRATDLTPLGELMRLENLHVIAFEDFDLQWLAPIKTLKTVRLKVRRILNSDALSGVDVFVL